VDSVDHGYVITVIGLLRRVDTFKVGFAIAAVDQHAKARGTRDHGARTALIWYSRRRHAGFTTRSFVKNSTDADF
jgi:hypothetical protein